jgi:hypothetical protein
MALFTTFLTTPMVNFLYLRHREDLQEEELKDKNKFSGSLFFLGASFRLLTLLSLFFLFHSSTECSRLESVILDDDCCFTLCQA